MTTVDNIDVIMTDLDILTKENEELVINEEIEEMWATGLSSV